ncbi:MAG: C-terminal binding protein [Acidobacteriota bacterium]|nr:C-terminal binding protein [Acidobacteriota bacterium]
MTKSITFKITDYIERDLEWEAEECRKLGVQFAHYQLKTASAKEIMRHVGDADVILVNMAKFDEELISGLPNVKLIIRHGIGYDNVDVPACTRQGIVFANEATASSEDVAEHAVLLMLETYKKKKIQDEILKDWIRTGEWSSKKIHPLYRLRGKTLGIVGCGNIGSRLMKKVEGFEMKVLVCDPYLSPEKFRELGTTHTPLDEVLRQADIITVHVPVTDETRGMFNYEKFSMMKRSAVIVNTARGPVLNTRDLIRALDEGLIAGAALDVFEEEPPKPKLELFKMDRVILSPHIAWYSEEGGWDIRYMIMDDVKAFLAGKLPQFVINREVLKQPNLRFKIAPAGGDSPA